MFLKKKKVKENKRINDIFKMSLLKDISGSVVQAIFQCHSKDAVKTKISKFVFKR